MRENGEGENTEVIDDVIYRSPDDAQRLLLSRLWLRTRALFEEQFGDLETAYVLMAVGLGRMNNAPVDISTIAAITGISRPTVRRKVLALQDQGTVTVERVGNRTSVCSCATGVRDTVAMTDRWARMVIQTAKDLTEVRSNTCD